MTNGLKGYAVQQLEGKFDYNGADTLVRRAKDMLSTSMVGQ